MNEEGGGVQLRGGFGAVVVVVVVVAVVVVNWGLGRPCGRISLFQAPLGGPIW